MRCVAMFVVAFMSLTASSAASGEKVLSPAETRQIAYLFGKCVVRHHPGGASKVVLRNVDNDDLVTHYSALIDSECLSRGQLVFPGYTYLYSLADALVNRELAGAPVPDLSNVPPLDHGPVRFLPQAPPQFATPIDRFRYSTALAKARQAQTIRALSVYGECVVRRSPADAKALLMTEPESPEESARFEALQPALSECMDKGVAEVKKIILRGTVALNYYRLVYTALQGPIR